MRIVNKRTIAGGLIVAGIALGTYLSGLFRGLGPGGGAGTHVSTGNGSRESPDETAPARPAIDPERPGDPDEPKPPLIAQPPSPHVLDVVIAGERYEIREVVDQRERIEQIELPALIERVKQAEGSADGIRVRVFRRESSLPTSEQALDNALQEAGIPFSAVYRDPKLLPDE